MSRIVYTMMVQMVPMVLEDDEDESAVTDKWMRWCDIGNDREVERTPQLAANTIIGGFINFDGQYLTPDNPYNAAILSENIRAQMNRFYHKLGTGVFPGVPASPDVYPDNVCSIPRFIP